MSDPEDLKIFKYYMFSGKFSPGFKVNFVELFGQISHSTQAVTENQLRCESILFAKPWGFHPSVRKNYEIHFCVNIYKTSWELKVWGGEIIRSVNWREGTKVWLWGRQRGEWGVGGRQKFLKRNLKWAEVAGERQSSRSTCFNSEEKLSFFFFLSVLSHRHYLIPYRGFGKSLYDYTLTKWDGRRIILFPPKNNHKSVAKMF